MNTQRSNNRQTRKEYRENTSVSILERMHDRSLFSDTDWNVSQFILEHLDEVPEMTVREVCLKTYSSIGTIIKFSKELGYDGFKSFKLALVKELESQKYIHTTVNFNTPFDTDDSAQNILNSMSSLYKESIDIAQTSLNSRQLERITDLILKSRRLILFGIGDSLITCESFINKLTKIGILAFSATQYSDAQSIAEAMNHDDVAVFVTYSAASEDLIKYAQKLKIRGIPVITLTANSSSVLTRISNETVLFKDMEGNTNERVATFYSQIVFGYILNCIYSLLYAKIK